MTIMHELEHEEVWVDGFYGMKYNPPRITITKDYIQSEWGWFFPGSHEGEPACYIEMWFDKNGNHTTVLDCQYGFIKLEQTEESK